MQNQQNMSPLVSVVIPVRDAAPYINRTLHSVLTQTYSHFEIIVVDDGSCDDTVEIVRSLAQTDTRIRLVQQANAGVAAARNLAIAHATGEYIAPLDADDLWFPTKLEKQVQVFADSSEAVGVVYAWSVFIDEADGIGETCQVGDAEGDILIPLLYGNLLGNASTPLIRRSCLENVGGYGLMYWHQQAQGCEDWDLYVRLAEHYHFRVVPEVLVGYRQVLGSMSFNHEAMARSRHLLFQRIQERHPEIPDAIYRWSHSNFNWYLAKRCQQSQDYAQAIGYLLYSARLDFLPLLRPGFYRLFWLSLLCLLLLPFRQQRKTIPLASTSSTSCCNSRKTIAFNRSPTINISVDRYYQFPRKQYSDFVLWRCWQIQKTMNIFVESVVDVPTKRQVPSL